MKRMKVGARCAAIAAVSAAGFLVAAQAAQAQVWFETRSWPQARYYEEAPPYYREAPPFYREAPRYVAPAVLPRRAVQRIIERQGFEVIGAMQFTGDAYIVQAVDRRGRVRRLVVDAHEGEIVESALAAQPRPPAELRRVPGPYATSPGVELPPGRMAPRRDWSPDEYGVPPPAVNLQEQRARERFARQTPEGMEGPVGRNDLNVLPGLPLPSADQRKAAPPKQGTVKKPPQKAAPKKQATRPPAAEAPQSAKAEPATALRPSAAKPQPLNEEASKPAAAKPEVVRIEPPATGSTRTEPAKVEAAAAPAVRSDMPKPSGVTPRVEKREAETRPNSMLRRPSQKADGAGATSQRQGVAEGPTVSSGAEPQRKAPRVVYPGPGAPAQSTTDEK